MCGEFVLKPLPPLWEGRPKGPHKGRWGEEREVKMVGGAGGCCHVLASDFWLPRVAPGTVQRRCAITSHTSSRAWPAPFAGCQGVSLACKQAEPRRFLSRR